MKNIVVGIDNDGHALRNVCCDGIDGNNADDECVNWVAVAYGKMWMLVQKWKWLNKWIKWNEMWENAVNADDYKQQMKNELDNCTIYWTWWVLERIYRSDDWFAVDLR